MKAFWHGLSFWGYERLVPKQFHPPPIKVNPLIFGRGNVPCTLNDPTILAPSHLWDSPMLPTMWELMRQGEEQLSIICVLLRIFTALHLKSSSSFEHMSDKFTHLPLSWVTQIIWWIYCISRNNQKQNVKHIFLLFIGPVTSSHSMFNIKVWQRQHWGLGWFDVMGIYTVYHGRIWVRTLYSDLLFWHEGNALKWVAASNWQSKCDFIHVCNLFNYTNKHHRFLCIIHVDDHIL